ncbi:serine/threonine-protein kinase 11-interacting protein-like [Stegodyphus dumicola]|uniref:serine/threonine-protein kinase 11-interacting protein-like n=1 Tax=Stegodyphus dumicola TaxID=202533 RepID=UPI0015AF92C8|nr:serine/threonine-protein kinase 11-interacting protein-like [Stegodyphus dumicola]
MQTLRGGVDLSHFSNLTVLELRKIPAHLIIGLESLSVQLKVLICTRSIYLLKEIFGSSVDENNTRSVWTELKELNLSYNYLENLDKSLESLPNIEILDLSHNHLRSTEEIRVSV